MSTCPSCAAERIQDHPAGLLVFSHTAACPIGNAEDGTRANDHSLLTTQSYHGSLPGDTLVRVTTAAENQLLASLGYLPSAVTTCTRVTVGGAVINRSFQLVSAT